MPAFDIATYFAQACAAEQRGEWQLAVDTYQAILEADPTHADAMNNVAAIAARFGDRAQAIELYRLAIQVAPTHRSARHNLARNLAAIGEMGEADQLYSALLAESTTDAALWVERIQAHVNNGSSGLADALAQEALSQMPDVADLWLARGNAALFAGEPELAERHYRHALQFDASSPRARGNLALALLTQGRHKEAWPLYEARYDPRLQAHDSVRFYSLPWPQWRGELLAGKRILLVREQGFGDQIQFIRYAGALALAGATVEVVAPAPLRALLDTAPGVSAVYTDYPESEHFDFWSPLLSIPYRLGLQSEDEGQSAQQPYLKADETLRETWRQQLAQWGNGRRLVGLTWAGSPGNTVDRRRSLPFAEVLRLVDKLQPQILFVSLQKDLPTDGSLEAQCRAGIIPVSDMLNDFSDTAALMAELDAVVSVDTSTAHLAGALGRPCLTLLPVGADWRWGQTSRHSRLYSSMTLLRQQIAGDWSAPVAEARELLSRSAGA